MLINLPPAFMYLNVTHGLASEFLQASLWFEIIHLSVFMPDVSILENCMISDGERKV